MIQFIFRLLWRFLILAIGVTTLWFAIFKLYPYADNRLPTFVVLLLLYSGFAYVVIPFLIRLFRLVIKPAHIPLYVATGDGWPSDPVNLALIVKDKEHLRRSMKKAGWYEADRLTFKSSIHTLYSIVFNQPYPTAPFSNLYLFNRAHDIGFEIPTGDSMSARTRHHVRFWKLDEPGLHVNEHAHFTFWKRQLQHFFGMEREIWIGAATEETHAIDLQWRTGQLTHGGSHDSDKERDFIIQTLRDSGFVRSVHDTEPGEELRFRGQQFRTIYITDGGIKVARLR